MKYLRKVILALAIGLASAVFAGNPNAIPSDPATDPSQSPIQTAPMYPIQVQEQGQATEDQGLSTEIWVAIIGVIGTLGAAFIGVYFQRGRSKKHE